MGGGEPGKEGGGGLEHGLPGQERGSHSQGNRHMEVSGLPPCEIFHIFAKFHVSDNVHCSLFIIANKTHPNFCGKNYFFQSNTVFIKRLGTFSFLSFVSLFTKLLKSFQQSKYFPIFAKSFCKCSR